MGANQFTTGKRTRMDESTKDKLRAEQLSNRLHKYAKAKGKSIEKYHMEPAQVAAAKVLIERGKPALQAIEQKIITETPQPEEMVAQLTHLFSQNPALLKPLLADPGFRAAVQSMLDGSPALVAPHQSAHSSDQSIVSKSNECVIPLKDASVA